MSEEARAQFSMHVSIAPDVLFHIAGFPVTNTLLTSWVVVLFLVALGVLVGRGLRPVPGPIQNAAEFVIESLLRFFEMIAGSRTAAARFFPVAATIFIFILAANWVGILPGVGSIGFFGGETGGGEHGAFTPLLRSVYSDLNMTLALALLVVTLTHVVGLAALRMGHVGKFINLKSPLALFVGLLELISEFAKVISFSFRLFGNVFAGEVLLVIVAFLVPYLAPVPFLGLELFVGFVQALIFSVLAMMFLSTAVVSHGEH